ncbi:hypothetical protein NMY22_g1354 [Coprinellus aureogranulatus]|nr:hypothetical protein NMY22_g1354 [Coprinellus aureogranulatus]
MHRFGGISGVPPAPFSSRKKGKIFWIHALKTGKYVVLVKMTVAQSPQSTTAVEIARRLSSGSTGANKRNHCLQPLTVLQDPGNSGVQIIVQPLLRRFDDPPFETIGETLDFVGQLFEGLCFMHENGVAHGCIGLTDVAYDADEMYPSGYHPCAPERDAQDGGPAVAKHSRTERPPTYYYQNFTKASFVRRIPEDECYAQGVETSVMPSRPKHDRTLSGADDRLSLDVLYLGTMLRHVLIDGIGPGHRKVSPGYEGFDFLLSLLVDMTQSDPRKRPSMPEAVARFEQLLKGVSQAHLRSRCRRNPKHESPWLPRPFLSTAVLVVVHWFKTITYLARGLPAIPKRV